MANKQISRQDKALEDKDYLHSPKTSPLKEVAYQIFKLNPKVSHTELCGILQKNHSPICPAKMTVYFWLKDWRYKDTIKILREENRRLLNLVGHKE